MADWGSSGTEPCRVWWRLWPAGLCGVEGPHSRASVVVVTRSEPGGLTALNRREEPT